MASDCIMKRGGDYDFNTPEEFLPILTEAIPFADEYLNQNSGDAPVKKMRDDLDQMVQLQRQRWVQLENTRGIQKNVRVSQQNTKTYQNKKYGFEIELPSDWKVRGLFGGRASNPEFDGPNGASLKFAIGPIFPEPSPEDHREKLVRTALKYGQYVQSTGYLTVMGKNHATITCKVPNGSDVLILKTYSIIYNGKEYLVTAQLVVTQKKITTR